MKTLVTAVALGVLIAPAFAQTAFVSEALSSISILHIIAFLFFVPLGLLAADRLVRGKSGAADADASLGVRREARGSSNRYAQVIGDLKRYALQPKWLVEGRLASQSGRSTATETASKSGLTRSAEASDGSSIVRSRSEDSDSPRAERQRELGDVVR
jgi:hypothetical protein